MATLTVPRDADHRHALALVQARYDWYWTRYSNPRARCVAEVLDALLCDGRLDEDAARQRVTEIERADFDAVWHAIETWCADYALARSIAPDALQYTLRAA